MPSRIIRTILTHGRGWDLCRRLVTPKHEAIRRIVGWGVKPAPFGWHWYYHYQTKTTFLITRYDDDLVITEQEYLASLGLESKNAYRKTE